ncbi:hypothetical protein IHQ71_28670 [Rhizobium sp. TH2]|uniref:spike base protein, RCAP_Rcc01079 family n=1 Tax=Rhizobium sp. TH2 TaxID=2775403 RepID=UPI0021583275|nr:hypothetical protein [Rhizobium sp. TH2]UVC09033.1 hypothetical protein IHQ71_28670 [Rhizobium sp. TH2]
MPDRFQNSSPSLSGPAAHGFAVTPNDTNVLSETTRALYVGSAGTLAIVMASGASVTFIGVASGTVLPVRTTKVMATGTSATDILGLV